MTKVSKTSRFAGLTSIFSVLGAALEVSRALEGRRMPPPGALRTLGIDEHDFRKTHVL